MSLVQFDRADIERLLGLLDERLRRHGVSASVYVIGGTAIAVTVFDGRRTLDVDVLVSGPVVLEEARLLAEEEGVPPTWLNDSARPWAPPRPPTADARPTQPGLIVRWAPLEHLLAMKLVAMRPQDAPDIVALVKRLGWAPTQPSTLTSSRTCTERRASCHSSWAYPRTGREMSPSPAAPSLQHSSIGQPTDAVCRIRLGAHCRSTLTGSVPSP